LKLLRSLLALAVLVAALPVSAQPVIPAHPHAERSQDTRATFGDQNLPGPELPVAVPTFPTDPTADPAPAPAPAAAAPDAFPPVPIVLGTRVAVRKYVPVHERRGTLASRSGRQLPQRYRVVYERRAATVDIAPIILKHANKHNVDPYLVKAVISVESNFNNNATSWAGAAGLMQLMPATGYGMGARNLYDPDDNIGAGTRYLRAMLDRYKGRLDLAIAAYNAGPGNVYDRVPNISETQRYVVKVMKAYKTFKPPAQ